MSQALDLPDSGFETFYAAICQKLDSLDIPKSLSALGVQHVDVPVIARKALADPARATNPCDSSLEQLEALLTQAIDRARD
ncbi:hypothetical protein JET76_01085 [Pseudomonas putida]|nr:hypothetical protein [Pseudomonas putida]MBI6939926.1 hypothetical protein [Pseudomonas putida]MBI6956104.1 hypothetical protein [Pseudomonas putida]